jgi:hypothetical protein
MSSPVPPPPVRRPPKPLFGLRRKPGRLALAVFRMPLPAYRHDAGWVLGRTFLLLVHTGRKTGQPHSMVAMVLQYARPGTRRSSAPRGDPTPTGCATSAPAPRSACN